VGPRAGLGGGNARPHRDSIPDPPARSQSVCRLLYPVVFFVCLFVSFFLSLLLVSLRTSSSSMSELERMWKEELEACVHSQ